MTPIGSLGFTHMHGKPQGEYVSARISTAGFLRPNTMSCTSKTHTFFGFACLQTVVPMQTWAQVGLHTKEFLGYVNVNNLTGDLVTGLQIIRAQLAPGIELKLLPQKTQWKVPRHCIGCCTKFGHRVPGLGQQPHHYAQLGGSSILSAAACSSSLL